jgi:hypothetical protein
MCIFMHDVRECERVTDGLLEGLLFFLFVDLSYLVTRPINCGAWSTGVPCNCSTQFTTMSKSSAAGNGARRLADKAREALSGDDEYDDADEGGDGAESEEDEGEEPT